MQSILGVDKACHAVFSFGFPFERRSISGIDRNAPISIRTNAQGAKGSALARYREKFSQLERHALLFAIVKGRR